MDDVRVIVAQGVTLRGPMRLRLSKAQLNRRPELKASRSGVVDLDGGQSISLKYGEVFGADDLSKLAKSSLELVAPPEPEPEETGAGETANAD